MKDIEKEFNKYLDISSKEISNELDDNPEEKPQEKIPDEEMPPVETVSPKEETQAVFPPPYDLSKLDKESRKTAEEILSKMKEQEERANSPEMQEKVAELKAVFSPQNERLFAAYLLYKGLITEDQARDYLKAMIPEDDSEKDEMKSVRKILKDFNSKREP